MSKTTILTGIRANNDMHIGHYFGALLPMIDMAHKKAGDYQINLFVPDLHSFTTPIDHTKLLQQVMQNLRVYVASGLPINNTDVHIYRQSRISAHSELTWILDCFTGMGEMGRMTQFKDKSSSLSEDRISVGLFNYPVLMAADILLYNAEYIPVGEDQTQHIEFTRDIAERLNSRFNTELFTVPKPVKEQHEFFGKDQGLRIKDLADPAKKMSKSDESGKGVIYLSDSPETAHKKIMSATTDNFGEIQYDPAERAGISNLLNILALLRNQQVNEVAHQYAGQTTYGTFKREVADELKKFIEDFQARLHAVSDEDILNSMAISEEKMQAIANDTLFRVQKAVGLR